MNSIKIIKKFINNIVGTSLLFHLFYVSVNYYFILQKTIMFNNQRHTQLSIIYESIVYEFNKSYEYNTYTRIYKSNLRICFIIVCK